MYFFFFKQKTAYEIYQCDWSSDVCSSDLISWILPISQATPAKCTGIIPFTFDVDLQRQYRSDRESVV